MSQNGTRQMTTYGKLYIIIVRRMVTYNEESWQQYNEKSSEMDPSRLSRQRKTKEHMEEDS